MGQILELFRSRAFSHPFFGLNKEQNFDPSISPLEKRRESPETLRMLLAAPFRWGKFSSFFAAELFRTRFLG